MLVGNGFVRVARKIIVEQIDCIDPSFTRGRSESRPPSVAHFDGCASNSHFVARASSSSSCSSLISLAVYDGLRISGGQARLQ
jgi:hypothetical protein